MTKRRFLQLAAAIVFALCLLPAAFLFAPTGTTSQTHFDTLIVLGCPANTDGSPSPEERARVLAAVAEYKAGRAQNIIVTGGAAHNVHVEAEVMAEVATQAGVPSSALVIEPQAHNTIENIWFSRQIMRSHGWRSAEIISDAAHVHRAGLILNRYRAPADAFAWRTYAAPWPTEYSRLTIAEHIAYEVLAFNRVRIGGFPPTPYLPPTH